MAGFLSFPLGLRFEFRLREVMLGVGLFVGLGLVGGSIVVVILKFLFVVLVVLLLL